MNDRDFMRYSRQILLGDIAIEGQQKLLDSHDILFQPGVNEDLAATAVWGTQMLASTPLPTW